MGDNGQQYPPNGDDLNQRLQDVGRMVRDGLNQAGERLRQTFDRLNQLWEESAPYPPSRLTGSREEEYLRRLARKWTAQDFLVTPDLAENMAIRSWEHADVWEISIQTRWETRNFEINTEPYTGGKPAPAGRLLPIWDYELPPVPDLRSQVIRERVPDGDEMGLCLACNGTGRAPCAACNGRGWVVCPDCKGRTKLRCPRCKGKGWIPDWAAQKRGPSKGFLQDQAERLASSVADQMNEVVDQVRQYVPLPGQNPTPGERPKGTIPCPECVEGEVDCTCGNGKRVCSTCQGVKSQPCPVCKGSGKVLRHREIVRRFDVRPLKQIVGETPIPPRTLSRAEGEVIATVDAPEVLEQATPPEGVPADVWRAAQEAAEVSRKPIAPDERPTLQVIEFLRVPVVRVAYLYGDEPYVFYAYGPEGQEKFYAETFPPRWKRVERFVRSVAQELMAPYGGSSEGRVSDFERYRQMREGGGRQRIPVEMPPVIIKEESPAAEPETPPASPESQASEQPKSTDESSKGEAE